MGYFSPRFGAAGLEQAADSYLRGERASNPFQRLVDDLAGRQPVLPDVVTTIDAEIQQAAMEQLGDQTGAVVVLDPRDGAVLALATTPSFDPNGLDANWQALTTDPRQPLFNRATQSIYPPGSTFKTVVAAAATDLGIVDLNRPFVCTQPFKVGELTIDCRNHSHQPTVNYYEAYAWSCNRTFGLTALELGARGPLDLSDSAPRPFFGEQSGLEVSAGRLKDYAHRFGFERDLPLELPTAPSRLFDPGQQLYPSLVTQTGFGQGQVSATPLVMALVAATIANGGELPAPHLLAAVQRTDGSHRVGQPTASLGRAVRPETAAIVNRMMELSVEIAYAQKAKIPNVKVAGKTGTAESGGGRTPHSWFIGYAPSDAPRIAIAAVVDQGGSGSDIATPLAQRVLVAGLAAHPR